MHPFPDMTGEGLLEHISRRATQQIVRYGVLLGVCAVFIFVCTLAMLGNFKRYFFVLLFVPAGIPAIRYLIPKIRQHQAEIRNGEYNEVFLRYGSPEKIAAVLADPTNTQLLDCKGIILTRAYLVMKDDLLTYLPLDRICRITVMHHKSRRQGYVYLDICTVDRRILNYRFENDPSFGSPAQRTKQIADMITAIMKTCAPECQVHCQYQ